MAVACNLRAVRVCSSNANVNSTVTSMVVQPDGGIVLGGAFIYIGGVMHGGVARRGAQLRCAPERARSCAADVDAERFDCALAAPRRRS